MRRLRAIVNIHAVAPTLLGSNNRRLRPDRKQGFLREFIGALFSWRRIAA